tara:strand:+ start:14240 stop:14998 length:759 start_codon:yes stop_codon:yes gene_type:complete
MRFLFALSLSISLTHADKFSSQYCEFQLPVGWNCALEGTEWVCQSTNADRKKEAIIILAAKVRGSKDSLPAYQAYLKQNKTFSLPGGKSQVSEPKYTKLSQIKSHQWVDSLHLASEVPGFYTRYMATVKGTLGVAVTFSVGQEHYNTYKDVFESVIQTLKVFDNRADYKKGKFVAVKEGGKGSLLDGDTVFIPEGKVDFAQGKKGKAGSSNPLEENLLWIVLLGAGAFAAVKLRKKKGGAKKGKKKKKKKSE